MPGILALGVGHIGRRLASCCCYRTLTLHNSLSLVKFMHQTPQAGTPITAKYTLRRVEKSSEANPVESYIIGTAAALNIPSVVSRHSKPPKNERFSSYGPKTNFDARETEVGRKIQTAEQKVKCRESFGIPGARGRQSSWSHVRRNNGAHSRLTSSFRFRFGTLQLHKLQQLVNRSTQTQV